MNKSLSVFGALALLLSLCGASLGAQDAQRAPAGIPAGPAQNARRLTDDEAGDYYARWSPDGTSILYASLRGNRAGIWKIAWPSGTVTAVETGLEGDHHMSWSPDGSQIVFDARTESGAPAIWIMPSAGGKPQRLEAAGVPSFLPVWSPDGRRIAFTAIRSGSPDIWVLSLDNNEAVQLTSGAATDHHPGWSPDGREIIFASDRDGDFDIWSVPASGGEPVCLWNGPGREDQPSFSPDGKRFVFTEIGSDESVIRLVSRESGTATPLARGRRCGWPGWSPDGKKIAISYSTAGTSDIWVVDVPADFEEKAVKPGGAHGRPAPPEEDSEIPEPDVAKLAEGVYRIVFPYKMRTNICVAIAPEGALVVDTGCDKAAVPRLREEIRKLGGERIAYLVTSHDNWDHVAGNSVAEPGTKLIVSDDLRRLVDEGLLEVSPGPMKGAAGGMLGTYYVLRFGGEEVRFIPNPGLHTDNDMLTYFVNAGVVHMGDLLLSESFPAVGNSGEYLSFLHRALDVFPLETQFVPGHGKLLAYRGVREYYYIMRAAEAIVTAAATRGESVEEIIAARALKDFESYNEFMKNLGTDSWVRRVFRSGAEPGEPFHALKGPYLGQKPPGTKAEVFAPGIISHYSKIHGRIVFSPDGREIWWTDNAAPQQARWFSAIGGDGAWMRPAASILSVEYVENGFCFSPDGAKLFFQSNRPIVEGGESKDDNIWYRARSAEGWSDPVQLGPPVNTAEYEDSRPWIAGDGTLYFNREEWAGAHGSPGHASGQNDIYCARFVNGKYEEPVKLGPEVNSEHHDIDPVVPPDGSYLIFASNRPGGYGRMLNLWISFRKADGGWTQAQCLNGLFELENTWFPSLSADGKYLFFSAGVPTKLGYMNTNYYWVDSACVEALRAR